MRRKVAQSCTALFDPVDCTLPGSSIDGIFQARVLEWVAVSFCRGSSWPKDRTQVFCIAGRRFTRWATGETPSYIYVYIHIYIYMCVCVPLLIYLCEYTYVCFIPFSPPWLVRGREMISEKRTFFFSYSSVHEEEIDNRSIPIFSLSISPLRSFHVNGTKHYYGQNYIPQKDTLKLLPLTSQNVTLFENRVCMEVIKLKYGH